MVEPHFQIRAGKTVAQLRTIVNASGWSAIDVLIQAFGGEENLDKPAIAQPITIPVTTHDEPSGEKLATELSIRAWLDGSKTWVSGADFCDYFGGTLQPAMLQVELNSVQKGVNLKRKGDIDIAPFADLNEVIGLAYL